ncbi:MAG: acyl--CoA ligase [Planctomycetes bacterium]|nr:acyl--CoA ligase [Planctomycetota bacterium]
MDSPTTTGKPLPDEAAIRSLITQAKHCEKMSSIEDFLPYRNFGDMWRQRAGESADRPWLHYYPCAANDEAPRTYSYGDFSDDIDRVASLLCHRYGIGAGASVATLTVNQPLTVAVYFATWRLSARVVPVNPGETDDRIGYIVRNSEATLLIAHRGCREDYAGVESHIGANVQRAMVGLGDGPGGLAAGWNDFERELSDSSKTAALPAIESTTWDAEALVVYTKRYNRQPQGRRPEPEAALCRCPCHQPMARDRRRRDDDECAADPPCQRNRGHS